MQLEGRTESSPAFLLVEIVRLAGIITQEEKTQ